jgi:hypothetical protein
VTSLLGKNSVGDQNGIKPINQRLDSMRKQLESREGKRSTYRGRFERFGKKSGYRGPIDTLLLTNIEDRSGNSVCDHIWFTVGKQFSELVLQSGDIVQFDARSASYTKGYKGRRDDVYDSPISKDFRLSNPTKVSKVYLVEDTK